MHSHYLPSPGTRISSNDFLAAVRYVGPVDGTSGTWLGVEWDDPRRGKHDGSKNGKQYFTCRSSTAGSFIRPTAHISYGVSFLDALSAKYIESLHGNTQEKITLGSSAGAIQVEAVSLDKIRAKFSRLDHLREVSLDNERVVRGDPPGRIRETCPNIRGLDLSQNLLPSWEAVGLIAKELHLLERLSLNRNRLELPSDWGILRGSFDRLMEVQLNNTDTNWGDLKTIALSMPNLQLVELGYNQLTRLVSGDSMTPTASRDSLIHTLNLDSNLLSDWGHVFSSLQEYPTLQRVVLAGNLIETIPFPTNPQDLFLSGIHYLSLSDNRLSSWASIDAIPTWFPSLQSLAMTGNPLMEDIGYTKNARPLIIAKIRSLTTLDGTLVTPRERTDSELFYLSYIVQHEPENDSERQRRHPRWEELCQQHGRPAVATKRENVQDKLSNHLITVELYPYSDTLAQKGQLDQSFKTQLQLLPTMTVKVMRLKVCKALKYDVRRTTLTCWLRLSDGTLTELDSQYNGKDINWIGLENGSAIIYKASL